MNHRRGKTTISPEIPNRIHNFSPFEEYTPPRPVLRERRVLKAETQKMMRRQIDTKF